MIAVIVANVPAAVAMPPMPARAMVVVAANVGAVVNVGNVAVAVNVAIAVVVIVKMSKLAMQSCCMAGLPQHHNYNHNDATDCYQPRPIAALVIFGRC